MARLTQWLMALAGLLTSASMSSCSDGNENEEPRPPADTAQSVTKPVKDGVVDHLPSVDDVSADEKPPINSENWYEFNVSDNRLSIPPKWYELYDVDIEDYKEAVSDDFDKLYVPSRAFLADTIANSQKTTAGARKDVSKRRSYNVSLAYGPVPVYQGPKPIVVWLASKTQVTGSRDRLAIIKRIRSYESKIQACYAEEFERNKNVGRGEVTVSWNIDEAGAVSGVTIESTALRNKRVEYCLVETIQRLRFPYSRMADSTHVKTVFTFAIQ